MKEKRFLLHGLAFLIFLSITMFCNFSAFSIGLTDDFGIIKQKMNQLGFQVERIIKARDRIYTVRVKDFTPKTRGVYQKTRVFTPFSLKVQVKGNLIYLLKGDLEKAGFTVNNSYLPRDIKTVSQFMKPALKYNVGIGEPEILSPKQGDIWYKGELVQIKWKNIELSYNRRPCKILLMKGNKRILTISDGFNCVDNKSYGWRIPSQIPDGNNYCIDIVDKNWYEVVTSERFSIRSKIKENPYIEKIIPTSGPPGKRITLYGKNLTLKGNRELRIAGYGMSYPSLISGVWADQSKMEAQIPTYLKKGKYMIFFVDERNNLISNKVSFVVTRSICSLNVFSPSSGSKWFIEKTYDIKWKSTGIPPTAKMKIKLMAKKMFVHEIANNIANNGVFRWKIPVEVPGRYRIRVETYDSSCYGESPEFLIMTGN